MIFQSSFYQTKRILLVEDCEPIRASIRGMLQQIGFEQITAVADAASALEKAELTAFDFVLADVQLENGLNGVQLFETLKKRQLLKESSCVALISADSIRKVVFGISQRQPDCYIQKPFTYLTLEKQLARAMQQRLALRKVFQALPAKPEQALLECDRVVKEAPAHALHALRLKGELLLQLGQAQQAVALYQQILQSRELSWALLGNAIALFQTGNNQALKQLQLLSKAEETRPEALDWLIRLSLQQQEPEQALSYAQELARAMPQSVEVVQVQAQLAALCQDTDEAIRYWQKASQQHRYSALDSAQHYLNPARLQLLKVAQSKSLRPASLLAKAEESLQALPKRFLTDSLQPELQLVQARIALLQGQWTQAQHYLSEALQQDPNHWSLAARVDLALLKLAFGDQKGLEQVAASLPVAAVSTDLSGAVESALAAFWQQQLTQLWSQTKGWMQQGQKDYRAQSFAQALGRLWQAFLYMPANSSLALSLWQTLANLPPAEKLRPMAQLLSQLLQQSQLSGSNAERFTAIYQQLAEPYKLTASQSAKA